MQDWMRWEPTRGRRRFSSLVLTPARITVGIGAALAIVAGFMPWAVGAIPRQAGPEPVFFSGMGGAGDGMMLLLLSGGAAFLVLHESAAMSRVRVVQVLPLILIVLAGLTWVNGYRGSTAEIENWARRGWTGSIAPGLWLGGIGVLVMAAGGVVLLRGILRWRRESSDPADLMKVSPRGIAEAIAGTIGILVGGAAGIALTASLTLVPVMGLIMLGAVMGALVGAYAGAWLAGAVADMIARRRAGTGGA